MSRRNRVRNLKPVTNEVIDTRPILTLPDGRKVRFGIPNPPDYIFKYRGRNRAAPAQEVWGKGTVSYLPSEAKYIPGEGNFVYYLDVPLPSRTVAPVEAIHSISSPKRMMMNGFRFISSLGKGGRLNRLVLYFNDFCEMTMMPFFLKDEYYSKPVKEIRNFIKNILVRFNVEESIADRTGEILGCCFEYDNAYRWRVQDLASETSLEKLTENLPNELDRLIDVLSKREVIEVGGQQVVQRFKNATVMFKWVWKIPYFKKRIREALVLLNLDNIKMDESDVYHSCLYGDYDTGGKTIQERVEIIKKIHGEDESKWPPRVMIQNTGNNW